jgi:hypothetical protein
MLSLAVAEIVILLETVLPVIGEVMETVGGIVSETVTERVVKVLSTEEVERPTAFLDLT